MGRSARRRSGLRFAEIHRAVYRPREESNMLTMIPWERHVRVPCSAFFVNSGILFNLYVVFVSMPVRHDFPESSDVSGVRSIVHLVLSWPSFIWVSVESEKAFIR
jgi:hypothetical protein